MFKKILIGLLICAGNLFALTGKDAQNAKIAVQEVIKVFKNQIKEPIIKSFIRIPYNINYSINIKNKNYFISEYKIRIIFKTTQTKRLYTDEKDYIIRFIVNADKNKVVKEEIYTLTNETIFDRNFIN